MSNRNDFRPRRLYRDTRRSAVAGVFSGIADYLGISVGATRIVGIIAILMMFPVGVVLYIIAAMVLQPMPDNAYTGPAEEQFVRALRRSPEETFSDVRYRFKNMENRLQKMERYVTSSRFDLDREFEELGRD
ncbi:MAG: envelope stress response membrane protein PspC [Gammaproteobacteria bacterium]|nr:envelope stress response membrane protein PspC [Gammaproteobacteria bacterium]